jgi:hypothetical protein
MKMVGYQYMLLLAGYRYIIVYSNSDLFYFFYGIYLVGFYRIYFSLIV